jgi:hypothetical protein
MPQSHSEAWPQPEEVDDQLLAMQAEDAENLAHLRDIVRPGIERLSCVKGTVGEAMEDAMRAQFRCIRLSVEHTSPPASQAALEDAFVRYRITELRAFCSAIGVPPDAIQ